MLAIADYAGGHWPELARKAAMKISGGEQDAVSLNAELLADIRDVLADKCKWTDSITTKILLEELNSDDLKPWATYNRGKPMSPRQLAKRLGEYGIKPKNLCVGAARPKGYDRAQFDDIFARYLSSSPEGGVLSATPATQAESLISKPLSSVASISLSSGSENPSATAKTAEIRHCSGVADKKGVAGEEIIEITI